jgi:hypothetical protein
LCKSANAGNIIQNPANLQATKVRRERKSSDLPEAIVAAIAREFRDCIFYTRVLPYERVIDRLARTSIPQDDCFALIRNAESRQVFRAQSALKHYCVDDFLRAEQISSGLCSTHPGAGKICSCSF